MNFLLGISLACLHHLYLNNVFFLFTPQTLPVSQACLPSLLILTSFSPSHSVGLLPWLPSRQASRKHGQKNPLCGAVHKHGVDKKQSQTRERHLTTVTIALHLYHRGSPVGLPSHMGPQASVEVLWCPCYIRHEERVEIGLETDYSLVCLFIFWLMGLYRLSKNRQQGSAWPGAEWQA